MQAQQDARGLMQLSHDDNAESAPKSELAMESHLTQLKTMWFVVDFLTPEDVVEVVLQSFCCRTAFGVHSQDFAAMAQDG